MLIALFIFPLVAPTKAQTGPTVTLSPATYQISQVGQTFTLNVTISNVQNLWFFNLIISWDSTVLSLVGTPQTGGFLEQAGGAVFIANPATSNSKNAESISDALESTTGASGSGVLATIEFNVTAQTSTSVQLGNVTLESPNPSDPLYGNPITVAPPTTSTTTITFVSGAPVANAGSDQTVMEATTVTFDGSKSLPSGSITAYAWSFNYNGANKTLTGANPTFTFNIPGIYVVTLVVTDSNGASEPATVTITVNNTSKPVAVIDIEGIAKGQSVPAGQAVTFNGTGSYESNNGTITKYLWQVNDIDAGTGPTSTYTFKLPEGQKSQSDNVTLTVFDASNQNDTASTQITVVPGSGQTATPTPNTTTATPTPSSTSSATASPTSTSAPNTSAQSGLPSYVVAITIIITLATLMGSTIWLRKRT